MICKASFHSRGDSQCFVDAAEVVVHEVQGHGMTVILNFLAESICQARKTAHSHAHCEVLPLNVRRC